MVVSVVFALVMHRLQQAHLLVSGFKVANISYLPTKLTAKDRAKRFPDGLHESGGNCSHRGLFFAKYKMGKLKIWHFRLQQSQGKSHFLQYF